MFNVRVYKSIWNKGKREVDEILHNQPKRIQELKSTPYFYDISIEFPPFVNLVISSGNWNSGKITRVRWDNDKRQFYCSTEDEFPSENERSRHIQTQEVDEEHLKNKCLRGGWQQLTKES